MKEFLQEWGTTILTGIAVMALVAIIFLLRPMMKQAFENTFNKFTDQMNSITDTPIETTTTTSVNDGN